MGAIDFVLTGALIGVALTQIGPFWRARNDHAAGWAGVGLFSAVAAFAAMRVGLALDVRPIWILLLQIVAVSGPFWFWRLTETLFDDGFKPRPWHWLILAALELVFALRFLGPDWDWALIMGRTGAGVLILYTLLAIARDAKADLIEARLKARTHVLILAGALALLTLSRPLLADIAPRLVEILARATPLIDIALISFAGRAFFRVERALRPPTTRLRTDAGGPVDPLAADLARLDALMRDEQVWREAGLTVAKLAAKAQLPEYRLRHLILERRGARNFSAFLAEYRLAEAARRLSDSTEARVPITTIAYDSGFASLGPFNRAFRDTFGVTPTSYRKGERASTSENLSPNL